MRRFIALRGLTAEISDEDDLVDHAATSRSSSRCDVGSPVLRAGIVVCSSRDAARSRRPKGSRPGGGCPDECCDTERGEGCTSSRRTRPRTNRTRPSNRPRGSRKSTPNAPNMILRRNITPPLGAEFGDLLLVGPEQLAGEVTQAHRRLERFARVRQIPDTMDSPAALRATNADRSTGRCRFPAHSRSVPRALMDVKWMLCSIHARGPASPLGARDGRPDARVRPVDGTRRDGRCDPLSTG